MVLASVASQVAISFLDIPHICHACWWMYHDFNKRHKRFDNAELVSFDHVPER